MVCLELAKSCRSKFNDDNVISSSFPVALFFSLDVARMRSVDPLPHACTAAGGKFFEKLMSTWLLSEPEVYKRSVVYKVLYYNCDTVPLCRVHVHIMFVIVDNLIDQLLRFVCSIKAQFLRDECKLSDRYKKQLNKIEG